MDGATLGLYLLYIFIMAIFVGFEIISKVPVILHTPLMSGTNAIHGIVLLGGMLVLGMAKPDDWVAITFGFIAVVFGAINVVGGFVVTDRMLHMFKRRKS
jgi:NAD(P) transhydrogenase subunit alpha